MLIADCRLKIVLTHVRLDWIEDWIEQCLTSPTTQYRLCGRQFYRSKQPTVSKYWRKNATKENPEKANNRKYTHTYKIVHNKEIHI